MITMIWWMTGRQMSDSLQRALKENYYLGFVTLPEGYDENALEDALERRMTRFLLELGEGWVESFTSLR